jgi:hypothetical protein
LAILKLKNSFDVIFFVMRKEWKASNPIVKIMRGVVKKPRPHSGSGIS